MRGQFHLPGIEDAVLSVVLASGRCTLDEISDSIDESDPLMLQFDHHGLDEQIRRAVQSLEEAGLVVVQATGSRRGPIIRPA